MPDKNSLLASLTGEQLGGPGSGEQDLFGDVTEDPPMASLTNPGHSNAGASLPPEISPPETSRVQTSRAPESLAANGDTMSSLPLRAPSGPPESLLSKSGLLGTFGDISGGKEGLFDDVDAEEHRKLEEEKRLREQEGERERRELEARQKEHQESQEALRQHEQQQHQQMMQQQQLQQKQFENRMYPPSYGQQHFMGNGNGMNRPETMEMNLNLQQSSMVHSSMMSPQQLTGQMQGMNLNDNSGFYREHGSSSIPGTETQKQNSCNAVPLTQNNYFYGTQQQQRGMQFENPSLLQSQPSTTAGMHNTMQSMNLGKVRKINLVKPQDVAPLYTSIRVTEPMLIQTQSFLISSPPYWSYQITSQLAANQGTWHVRRRFRHVVALEDRLRQSCPGSILPPRPDKHATRALEEASTQQSAEFAVQRAKELEQYLNQLAKHPAAGQSQALRLFLGLQDDIGTAWAECSSNALTRLGAVGAGVSIKVAESTNLTAASAPAHEWEEDAELLGLCSSENLRLGAVSQAVPKLEGTVIVLRELGDNSGALGMELSKASKMVDMEFKMCEILSTGLLRHGRRTKRLALEMSAAMESFLHQYKLVRYEKMAMHDRRQAIQKKAKERGKADSRALYLSRQQHHLQINGQIGHLNHLEHNAIQMDSQALHAVDEADEIGARLKSEIHRVAISRRLEWNTSIKTIASSMKEACGERVAIWESTFEAFESIYNPQGQGQISQQHPQVLVPTPTDAES